MNFVKFLRTSFSYNTYGGCFWKKKIDKCNCYGFNSEWGNCSSFNVHKGSSSNSLCVIMRYVNLIELTSITAGKVSKYEVISGPFFPYLGWIRRDISYLSVFSPNARKCGPEITLYLDTFHAVYSIGFLMISGGNRSFLICLNSHNTKSEIWRRSQQQIKISNFNSYFIFLSFIPVAKNCSKRIANSFS